MSEGRVQAIAAALRAADVAEFGGAYALGDADYKRLGGRVIAADDAWLAEHPEDAPWLERRRAYLQSGKWELVYRVVKP